MLTEKYFNELVDKYKQTGSLIEEDYNNIKFLKELYNTDLSCEAKALHAYIFVDHFTHPDYLEIEFYKTIWTLLRWEYRKTWKNIAEICDRRNITACLCGQDDYCMRIFNELAHIWKYLRSHLEWGGYSVFTDKDFFTYRVINYN